jgi:hypothetical protein
MLDAEAQHGGHAWALLAIAGPQPLLVAKELLPTFTRHTRHHFVEADTASNASVTTCANAIR